MSSSERRASRRLTVDLQLSLRLDGADAGAPQVQAQLVDVGADGNGAGLHVPLRSPVMLGRGVSLLFAGAEIIHGVIVSRFGTPRYERLGIRIDTDCAEQVRAIVSTLPPRR